MREGGRLFLVLATLYFLVGSTNLLFADEKFSPAMTVEDASLVEDFLMSRPVYARIQDYDEVHKNSESERTLFRLQYIGANLGLILSDDPDWFWKIVPVLKRSIKGQWDIFNDFRNPMNDIVSGTAGIFFDKLVSEDRSYLFAPDISNGKKLNTPLTLAVSQNNSYWVEKLIDAGVSVNSDAWFLSENTGPFNKVNLLSLSKANSMDQTLIKAGIAQTCSETWKSHCLDNNVRIRKSPSLGSEILGKFNLNDAFTVTGYSYKVYHLPDGKAGRWVKVQFSEMEGWIWSDFVAAKD